MIEWKYAGEGWLDVWTDSSSRCMITRHPQKHRGEYVIWIDGEVISSRDELGFAKWKASKLLEGDKA